MGVGVSPFNPINFVFVRSLHDSKKNNQVLKKINWHKDFPQIVKEIKNSIR